MRLPQIGLIMAMLLLAGASASDTEPERCRASHTVLPEHPSHAHTVWSRDLQGIAHDDENWFVTNIDGLYKIPASVDLGRTAGDAPTPDGWVAVPIPTVLASRGFNHFGDLSWYGHVGEGYLCVPVEGGGRNAVLAFFRASDLEYLGHSPVPGDRHEAAFCAIDQGGLAVLPDRSSPVFQRYRIDWDGVAAGAPGKLEPVGPLKLRLEDGSPFEEQHFGGATFTPNGRLLYILTGYYDDHTCPIWDSKYWAGACEVEPELGGIHVFDLRDGAGAICRGSSACDGVRIDRSYNSQDRSRGSFQYRYLGQSLRGEEPEGITFWDLDSEGAPRPPGITGQVHALMLDNELFSAWDLVSLRHYRATVQCPLISNGRAME